jgi:hypothetical protein
MVLPRKKRRTHLFCWVCRISQSDVQVFSEQRVPRNDSKCHFVVSPKGLYITSRKRYDTLKVRCYDSSDVSVRPANETNITSMEGLDIAQLALLQEKDFT